MRNVTALALLSVTLDARWSALSRVIFSNRSNNHYSDNIQLEN